MKTTKTTVDEILRHPYSRILIPQEEGGFAAEILEFAGCFAEGESAEEAYERLEEAARSWLAATLEKGDPVPPPLTNYENSGKFALRLPRGLYTRAAKVAAKEGVSLNQFIIDAVAERTGEFSTIHRMERVLSEARTVPVRLRTLRVDQQSLSTDRSRFIALPRLMIDKDAINSDLLPRN